MGFYYLELDELASYKGTTVDKLKKKSYTKLEEMITEMKQQKIMERCKRNAEDEEYERLVLKYFTPVPFLRYWFSDEEIVLACAMSNISERDLCSEEYVKPGHRCPYSKAEYIRTSFESVRQYDNCGRELADRRREKMDVYRVPSQFQGTRHGKVIQYLLYQRHSELAKFDFSFYEMYGRKDYEIYPKNNIYTPFTALMSGNVDHIIHRNREYCKWYNNGRYSPEECEKAFHTKEALEMFELIQQIGERERIQGHLPVTYTDEEGYVSANGLVQKAVSKSGHVILLEEEVQEGIGYDEKRQYDAMLWFEAPFSLTMAIMEFLSMMKAGTVFVHIYYAKDYFGEHDNDLKFTKDTYEQMTTEKLLKLFDNIGFDGSGYVVSSTFGYKQGNNYHMTFRINYPEDCPSYDIPYQLSGNVNKRQIIVLSDEAAEINRLLEKEPESESDCFSDTISYTAQFDNGIEMDIKICGVDYEEGGSNKPYAEAVLFKNGCELCCSEPDDEFFQNWELEYEGVRYIVKVVAQS